MGLLPYSELSKIDVLPFCDMREAKDERGRKIQVPYLNWAKCVQLLHQYGAEVVYYTPLHAPDGGYLFPSLSVENKDGRRTGCWFVSVEIHIDDLAFTMDMPLTNGALVVYEDTLNQQRIANCHARAFVKGVAVRTGLGFDLWIKEPDTDGGTDDLSGHSILAVKERVNRLITERLQQGKTKEEIAAAIGIKREKDFDMYLAMFDKLYALEQRLRAL